MRMRWRLFLAGLTSLLVAAVVVWTMRRAPPATVLSSTANVPSAPTAIDDAPPESVPIPAVPTPPRAIVGGERSRLWRQLVARLGDLRSRIAGCRVHESSGDGVQHGPGSRETVLTLEVQVLDGRMEVVDAVLQSPGSASEAFVACAQSSLRGQVFPAPAAKAGGRLRVPLRLGFRGAVTPD